MPNHLSFLNFTRSLIEASIDPLVTIDSDGKFIDVNSATETMTGVMRDKLIGTDFSSYFTDPAKARCGYQRAFAEGHLSNCSLAIRHTSGSIIEVLCNASIYYDESGEIAGIFASAHDITAMKQTEEQLRAASHYARSLIEASQDPLVTISADGTIMDANKAAEKVTGVSREKIIGSDFSDYFTEPEKARIGYKLVFSQGFVTDYPLAIRHTSGTVTEVLYNASVYQDENGKVAGVFAAARDISKLLRSQQELEKSNREILTMGQMTEFLQSCQSAEETYPIIQSTLAQLFPDSSGSCFILNDASEFLEEVAKWGDSSTSEPLFHMEDCWALRRGHLHSFDTSQSINVRCKHVGRENASYLCVPLLAHGHCRTLGTIHLTPVTPLEGKNVLDHRRQLAVSTADNISLALTNLKLRESLKTLSLHDPLTGLFNRRFMEETMDREIIRATRLNQSLIIAILDIDHFKNFNDTYGHNAGDLALKQVGAILKGFRSGLDVSCRFGGEEFILILTDITLEQATTRLESLREAIGKLNLSVGCQSLPRITISMGVSRFPPHGTTATELIKSADEALYQAKKNGRNRMEIAGAEAVTAVAL